MERDPRIQLWVYHNFDLGSLSVKSSHLLVKSRALQLYSNFRPGCIPYSFLQGPSDGRGLGLVVRSGIPEPVAE